MPIIRRLGAWMPSLLLRNIIANMVGKAWMMAMSFAFVPVYVHLLGIESYGIIGFYATLMVVFSVLDLGLSATLNRELARRSAMPDEHEAMADIVRTLELFYWAIGLAIGATVFVLAPYLARHWLHAGSVPIVTVERVIRLIGVTMALQWPTGLYGGGITGLQRFVWANMKDIGLSTLRGLGGIAVLLFVSLTLEAYFIWQLLTTALNVYLMARLLWRALPPRERRPRVDLGIFRSLWRFSAGMTGISLFAIVVQQADKVLLSMMLPLAVYAKYMIGTGLAVAAGTIASMVLPTLYPRLNQAVAVQPRDQLIHTYHRCCQLTTASIVPIAVTVACFPFEIILFWTHNLDVASAAAPITRFLVIGTAFTILAQMPYVVQLASGSTKASLFANAIYAMLIVPCVYILAKNFGAVGAAFATPLLAGIQLLVLSTYLHHKFLPGINARWLLQDIGIPSATALVVALAARAIVPSGLSPLPGFAAAVVAGGFVLASTAASLPEIRRLVWTMLEKRRSARRASLA